jgi:hypothetical protein
MSVIDFLGRCRVAFRFLEELYGFPPPVMVGDGVVEYRGRLVTVTVRFDYRRSYELETEFSARGQAEPSFSLGELLLLHEGTMPQAVQVTTEEVLELSLNKMALLVRDHATRLLDGDAAEFESLSEQRQRVSKQKQEIQQREDAIRAAQIAWTGKDYSTVVRLLGPLEATLSPSKTKLLKLARDRIGSGTP